MNALQWQPLLCVVLLAPSYADAQIGLRQHDIGFDITLSLPVTWVADDEATLSRTRDLMLEAMRGSDAQYLRERAAQNQNTLIYRARDSQQRLNSMNVNVGVDATTQIDAFSAMNPEEVASIAALVCDAFTAEMQSFGALAVCTRHEVVTLENRGVLVLHQEMTIPERGVDNRRMIALIPSDGMLFTLSMSVTRADYDGATLRTILASIDLPSGI